MLVRQLPDNWQNKHGSFSLEPRAGSPNTSPSGGVSKRAVDALPRTPLHLLGQASARSTKEEEEAEHDGDNVRRSRFGGRQSLPW